MCLSPVGLVCCMWSRISRCWWPNWSWRISERFGGMDIYIIYFTFTLTHKNLYGKKPFCFSTEGAHLMIVSFQVEKFEITHERNMICLRLHKIEITQERINVIFYVYFILSWMKNDNFEVQGGEVAHKLWRWPPTSILLVITLFLQKTVSCSHRANSSEWIAISWSMPIVGEEIAFGIISSDYGLCLC